MIKLINSDKNKNYLVTIAIGKKLFSDWKKYAYPSWKLYCRKNGLGLICFDHHLIDKKNIYFKKPHWQKYLIGHHLKNEKINNVCYLDTDFIINPFSPDIFKKRNMKFIYASSNIYGLPYNLEKAQKNVSYYRKKYINNKYPLDSAIFASKEKTYKFANLSVKKDDLCSGLFVFNLKKHSALLESLFFNYYKNPKSLTEGDQIHFSFHLLKSKIFKRLDYKFQAYWIYEMAINYPFLYFIKNKKVLKECVLNTLMNNYFLHFPGSWIEGRMWKNFFIDKKNLVFYKKLYKYYQKKVVGKPVGKVLEK